MEPSRRQRRSQLINKFNKARSRTHISLEMARGALKGVSIFFKENPS
ncbi:hypothetical protein PPTG_12400 [Phytophthora nicotianae INRA-310]|uniref:Uncharacterized protein n=1 Tax=Phytophthora nicotianae (strain INRA-310) TaxID=761204 RepID=W2Q6I4_PHYN3|nr:hypothetical protein PPTG_12400 [Phytophthora nicotianae INRA-310]ETN07855.1 hypothetical protein PPTG_12400 [Phytophthora nicotianae INRA-310]